MESSVRHERQDNVHGQDRQPNPTHSQHQMKYDGSSGISYIANSSCHDWYPSSSYAFSGGNNRAGLHVDGSMNKENAFNGDATPGAAIQAFEQTYTLDVQRNERIPSKPYIDRLVITDGQRGQSQAELSPLEPLPEPMTFHRESDQASKMARSKTFPTDLQRNGRGFSYLPTWAKSLQTYEDFIQSYPQTSVDVPTAPSTPSLTSLSSGSSSNSSVSSRSDRVHSLQRTKPSSRSAKKPSRLHQAYAMQSTKSPNHFDEFHENLTRNENSEYTYDAQTESSNSPEPTSEPHYEQSIASYDSSQSIATDDSNSPFILRVDEPETYQSLCTPSCGPETMQSIGSFDYEQRASGPIETVPGTTETSQPGLFYPVSPIVRAPSRAVSDRSNSFSAVSPLAIPLPVSPANTPIAYDASATFLAPIPSLVPYTSTENTPVTASSTPWTTWDHTLYTDTAQAEHCGNSGLPTYSIELYEAAAAGGELFCFQGLDGSNHVNANHSLLTVPNMGRRGWAHASTFSSQPLSNSESTRARTLSLNSASPAPSIGVDMASPGSCFTGQPVEQPQRAAHIDNLVIVSQETVPIKTSDQRQPPKRKQFQCIFCDVEYTTKNAWIRHETELHESPKKWQCPDCKATFLNEALFTRHHKQNHSCHDCHHANEAKIELPRKTAWACGFCADVFKDWGKRCDHVAQHFAQDNKTKRDWDFSNVISGLLTQKWVATAWQTLLGNKHGTNAEDQPKFRWLSTNPSCLELQQDLEHGLGVYEDTEGCNEEPSRLEQLVQTAYRLGTSEDGSCSHDTPPVLPGDSESIANCFPTPPRGRDREYYKGVQARAAVALHF